MGATLIPSLALRAQRSFSSFHSKIPPGRACVSANVGVRQRSRALLSAAAWNSKLLELRLQYCDSKDASQEGPETETVEIRKCSEELHLPSDATNPISNPIKFFVTITRDFDRRQNNRSMKCVRFVHASAALYAWCHSSWHHHARVRCVYLPTCVRARIVRSSLSALLHRTAAGMGKRELQEEVQARSGRHRLLSLQPAPSSIQHVPWEESHPAQRLQPSCLGKLPK